MRKKEVYRCQTCNNFFSKWEGKCRFCNSWNSIVIEDEKVSHQRQSSDKIEVINISQALEQTKLISRHKTFSKNLDDLLGGGFAAGSSILIGGEPGVGKSTLMLQILDSFSGNSLYISAEETVSQIALRANRINAKCDNVSFANVKSVESAVDLFENSDFELIVIDSIQTIRSSSCEGSSGSISQTRICTDILIEISKRLNKTILIISHINKDGQIAGPKTLEHMVDAVFQFEGESSRQYRLLRAIKNRFGSTNEIVIFDMKENGLRDIENPSSIFLNAQKNREAIGSAVVAGMEGSKPIFVEIQTLISPCFSQTPKRSSVGWDSGKLALIVAVLSARSHLKIADKDIYLNVSSGFKISEPYADLAAVAALMSSYFNKPLPKNCAIFGEVSLSGFVNSVSNTQKRIIEADKLGFKLVICPAADSQNLEKLLKSIKLKIMTVDRIHDLLSIFDRDKKREINHPSINMEESISIISDRT